MTGSYQGLFFFLTEDIYITWSVNLSVSSFDCACINCILRSFSSLLSSVPISAFRLIRARARARAMATDFLSFRLGYWFSLLYPHPYASKSNPNTAILASFKQSLSLSAYYHPLHLLFRILGHFLCHLSSFFKGFHLQYVSSVQLNLALALILYSETIRFYNCNCSQTIHKQSTTYSHYYAEPIINEILWLAHTWQ